MSASGREPSEVDLFGLGDEGNRLGVMGGVFHP